MEAAMASRALDILVVDDTPDCCEVIRLMLESRGFQVRVAACGEAALAELQEQKPDVMLLDVMMPGMSGLEVLERVRAMPEVANLPVILLTGCVTDDDMVCGYQHGADYYIPKPCTARQIAHGLGLVLGRADVSHAA
jgi:DNA-binding response OmpR family regulator